MAPEVFAIFFEVLQPVRYPPLAMGEILAVELGGPRPDLHCPPCGSVRIPGAPGR